MIKGAFAQYLSPDMVDSLIEEPDKLKLGGEKRVMSIMFCDVRGFTAISEALKTKPEKFKTSRVSISHPTVPQYDIKHSTAYTQGGTLNQLG